MQTIEHPISLESMGLLNMANAESPSESLNHRSTDVGDEASYTLRSPRSIQTNANSDGHESRAISFLSEDSLSVESRNWGDRKFWFLKEGL